MNRHKLRLILALMSAWKTIKVKWCCFLGEIGIRWVVSHIQCDHCGKPVAIYSDCTSEICVSDDQTLCRDCYSICRQTYE